MPIPSPLAKNIEDPELTEARPSIRERYLTLGVAATPNTTTRKARPPSARSGSAPSSAPLLLPAILRPMRLPPTAMAGRRATPLSYAALPPSPPSPRLTHPKQTTTPTDPHPPGIAGDPGPKSGSLAMRTRPLPPSGREPDQTRKEYCTYWIKTGECDFTQQGCLFKHEMPDLQTLREKVGIGSVPHWYQVRCAMDARRTAGTRAETPEWLRERSEEVEEEESESEDEGTARDPRAPDDEVRRRAQERALVDLETPATPTASTRRRRSISDAQADICTLMRAAAHPQSPAAAAAPSTPTRLPSGRQSAASSHRIEPAAARTASPSLLPRKRIPEMKRFFPHPPPISTQFSTTATTTAPRSATPQSPLTIAAATPRSAIPKPRPASTFIHEQDAAYASDASNASAAASSSSSTGVVPPPATRLPVKRTTPPRQRMSFPMAGGLGASRHAADEDDVPSFEPKGVVRAGLKKEDVGEGAKGKAKGRRNGDAGAEKKRSEKRESRVPVPVK